MNPQSGEHTSGGLHLEGAGIVMNGSPVKLWGIRTASAAGSEVQTEHLLAQLDEYRLYGINAVTVFLMGCAGGNYDPFSPDGREIDPGHKERISRIIEACGEREMVVILGVFYQMKAPAPLGIRLRDWNACREAVAGVARFLRERKYDNVIVNIANEQNSVYHDSRPWNRVRSIPDLIDLCRIVHDEEPGRITGCGGYDHANNVILGRSPEVDVLLFDTSGTAEGTSGELCDRFVREGTAAKPIVNVELFGGWTARFQPAGVFPEEVKQAYRTEIDAARERPELHVFFHNNLWCQSPGAMRYDLGGRGTPGDPGIRWYAEYIRERKARG